MKNPFEIYTSVTAGNKKKPLDWEESAVDAQSSVDAIHDAERLAPNVSLLLVLLSAVFILLSGRIFFLQIIRGADFRALSDSNRVRSQTILAPRGLILDRTNQTLAQNTASFNLVAVPFDLPKNQSDLETEIAKAAATFSFDGSSLLAQLKAVNSNSLLPIAVKQNISHDQAILFETRANEFLGLSVQQIPIRQYINAPEFSHVLGYAGLVSQQDLTHLDAQKYDTVDYTGKTGIEAGYENFLHGINGQNLVEVDATGKLLDILGENSPTPGNSLQLNIDKGLQEEIYKELSAGKNPKSAAVAINPKTGQILALVSLPGFDNNLFAAGIGQQDYSALLNDKNLPLINRAIAGTYPPGSTVKPMVGLAGLQEKIITPATVINDRGSLVIPNQFDPSIKYTFYGWTHAGLGLVNIYEAIAQSDDIYFYTVAGGYPNSPVPVGLGAEKLADYYKKFNLGSLSGIDIPGEKPGLVPTPEWKAEYYKSDPILSKWYLGDTYHIGIGQGDLLVTPLQVAEWTAIIANSGIGMQPQILNKVTNQNGGMVYQSQPKILVNKFLDDANLKVIQDAMRDTVTVGSGRGLANLPVEVAGKSGTSQFDGSDLSRTHAWFTAYAPFQDPQIVVTVLIEAGGEGHTTAEPVVHDAILYWAKNIYKK